MHFDPDEHHRRTIRLRGYDYSQGGAYFITICAQDRACLFGSVVGVEMVLNGAGQMVGKWWEELPRKFSGIIAGEYVVMPNHFHGIVLFGQPAAPVGDIPQPTRGRVVEWFKTMTTNEYIRHVKEDGWAPFQGRLWQRNYYER